jgi:hypothetical protein
MPDRATIEIQDRSSADRRRNHECRELIVARVAVVMAEVWEARRLVMALRVRSEGTMSRPVVAGRDRFSVSDERAMVLLGHWSLLVVATVQRCAND